MTVHGEDAVVVVSAKDFAALTSGTKKASTLVELLQNSPLSEIEFGRESFYPPVRPVEEL